METKSNKQEKKMFIKPRGSARDLTQLVEHLPSKHDAQSSDPAPPQIK
jgi:hypothetical protein